MLSKPIIQKIVVGGAVIKDNKILIIQRSADEEAFPNLWEFPSGKRENFEPSEDAVTREVKEETNLDVKVLKPISTFEYKVEKENEIRDATQINFLVEYISGDVKISNEHQAFKWISKNEMNKYNLTDSTKKVIEKALDLIN